MILYTFKLSLQQKPQWETGSPLSFQLYEYTNYKTRVIYYKHFGYREKIYYKENITASTFLYPFMYQNHRCTVMLLFNLAEPDWISVPCAERTQSQVVCYLQHTNLKDENPANIKSATDSYLCSAGHILIQETCHMFVWINRRDSTRDICKKYKAMPVSIKSVKLLTQVFDAVSLKNEFPPLFIENTANSAYLIKFQRSLNMLKYKYQIVPFSHARGFYVCNCKK